MQIDCDMVCCVLILVFIVLVIYVAIRSLMMCDNEGMSNVSVGKDCTVNTLDDYNNFYGKLSSETTSQVKISHQKTKYKNMPQFILTVPKGQLKYNNYKFGYEPDGKTKSLIINFVNDA